MGTLQPITVQKTRFLALDYHVASGLCYLPLHPIQAILAIVWIWTEPKTNRLVRFHAWQSLLLLLLTVVIVALGGVGEAVVLAIDGRTKGIATAVGILFLVVAFLFVLAMTIAGLISGFKGHYWKMPLLGSVAERLA